MAVLGAYLSHASSATPSGTYWLGEGLRRRYRACTALTSASSSSLGTTCSSSGSPWGVAMAPVSLCILDVKKAAEESGFGGICGGEGCVGDVTSMGLGMGVG